MTYTFKLRKPISRIVQAELRCWFWPDNTGYITILRSNPNEHTRIEYNLNSFKLMQFSNRFSIMGTAWRYDAYIARKIS